MTEQAMVDLIAKSAEPRLMDLLKLKIRHVYETTPGDPHSALDVDGISVEFKQYRTEQPYKGIERFMAEDKLIGFIVNPGLLSIVKTLSMEIRGRKMLVTRRIKDLANNRGAVAHLDNFGVRIRMVFDPDLEETQIIWECLYAVA